MTLFLSLLNIYTSFTCRLVLKPEGRFYHLIYSLALTFSQNPQVMTKRMKLQIQDAEISFHCGNGQSCSDSLILYLSSRPILATVASLCWTQPAERGGRHLIRISPWGPSPWRYSEHVWMRRRQEYSEEIMYSYWSGNASGWPRRCLEGWERTPELLLLVSCHWSQDLGEEIERWKLIFFFFFHS